MNKFIHLALIFIFLIGSSAEARPSVGWESPLPTFDLNLRVVGVSPTGLITVELSNCSNNLIKIWKEINPWGCARWRVLLIRRGRLETFFQFSDIVFMSSLPTFDEVAAGKFIERKLDLNGGSWCGLGTCSRRKQRGFGNKEFRVEPGDMIIVIYDVPPTDESYRFGVWNGTVAAVTTIP